jgi:regulator of replication initiation timing
LLHDQINIIKNDSEQTIQLNDQLREEMKHQTEAFAKQYREYNEQIADLMSENNVFDAENSSLKD